MHDVVWLFGSLVVWVIMIFVIKAVCEARGLVKHIQKTKILTTHSEAYSNLTRGVSLNKTTFMVWYTDGTHEAKTVTTGSGEYDKLMSYLEV